MTSVLATSLSTLDRIRTKVRRVTGTPSPNQLTDNAIDDYINTFFLFDMPELVRLFNLRELYEFYTEKNIEVYTFPRNEFTNIYQPIYIAGYQSFFTESREQFYRIYPQLQFVRLEASGNGSSGPYNFQFENRPILRGITYPPDTTVFSQVLVSSSFGSTNVLARDDGVGGFLDENDNPLLGSIDYDTGAITGLIFSTPIPLGTGIDGQSVPFEASRPEALLFFNDVFIIRPIPDKVYQVSIEAQKRPTALLSQNATPELEEWWQFLAFGASKKILEDRQDMVAVASVLPLLNEQKRLILRRTSQQLVQERVATIYTEQVQYPYGNFFNRF